MVVTLFVEPHTPTNTPRATAAPSDMGLVIFGFVLNDGIYTEYFGDFRLIFDSKSDDKLEALIKNCAADILEVNSIIQFAGLS